jgi:probable addiction module antidote protein
MSRGGLNISCFSTNSTAIEEAAKVLNRALAHGDTTAIMNTLGVIARERGMSHVARETGLARESLYRSTDAKGNPEFATALRVLASIGLRLEA